MIAYLTSPDTWAALATLTVLEVILGIDNLVFLAIISARLPQHQQRRARAMGLALALILRVGLLTSLTLIAQLTTPVATIGDFDVSYRDLVLGIGGLYLLYKGVTEIHEMVESGSSPEARPTERVFTVVLQIMALDLVFSLDSIVTAVGMTNNLPVMIAAIMIAVLAMLFAAEPISGFIEQHQSVKVLALAFLILVGTALVADGCHFHIPRGYLYAAIAFSLLVEAINLWVRSSTKE
jgi:predicted tellurium resistance membrane protein TerC